MPVGKPAEVAYNGTPEGDISWGDEHGHDRARAELADATEGQVPGKGWTVVQLTYADPASQRNAIETLCRLYSFRDADPGQEGGNLCFLPPGKDHAYCLFSIPQRDVR